jgi:hypothetical protein
MTIIPTTIKLELIPGSRGRYWRLLETWGFYSGTLKSGVLIPKGFVWDLESTSPYRGQNPMAGTAHDYLCRKDSDPIVSKEMAAKVYHEIACHEDGNWTDRNLPQRIWDWITNKVKRNVVIVAPGYFHKHEVMAHYEDFK